MIRTELTPGRLRAMSAATDLGELSESVELVMALRGQVLLPIRHARGLCSWLGRVQAHLGLGFPPVLHEFRSYLVTQITALEHHPALYGHGMLGHATRLPITCWAIPGARRPWQLYSMHPEGTEGCLIPTLENRSKYTKITFWTFEPMEHGPPRLVSEMFRSSFATRRRDDSAKTQAAVEAVKAAILADEALDDADQASFGEDGGDLP